MKATKTIAGILSVALLLTGCSSDDSSSVADTSKAETTTTTQDTTTTEATTTTAETTTTVETTTTEEETDAGENSGDVPQPETPASPDEAAAAKAAMDGFLKANADKDYAALVQYYDVDLMYYMTTGNMGTEDELIQYLKDQEAGTEGSVFVDYTNAEIGELECYNSMAAELNDFLSSDYMKEGTTDSGETITLDMAENFQIDGMYSFPVSVEASSDEFDYSSDMAYSVLHINGEWKVDVTLTLVWSFAQMFEDMGALE